MNVATRIHHCKITYHAFEKAKEILSLLVQCVYIYSNAKMPELDMFENSAYV